MNANRASCSGICITSIANCTVVLETREAGGTWAIVHAVRVQAHSFGIFVPQDGTCFAIATDFLGGQYLMRHSTLDLHSVSAMIVVCRSRNIQC